VGKEWGRNQKKQKGRPRSLGGDSILLNEQPFVGHATRMRKDRYGWDAHSTIKKKGRKKRKGVKKRRWVSHKELPKAAQGSSATKIVADLIALG